MKAKQYIKKSVAKASGEGKQVMEGITLLQNAANAIGEFNKISDEWFNFQIRILDNNANLKELETLRNKTISQANLVGKKVKEFVEWAKKDQKTINDNELQTISIIIARVNTYVNDTNIILSHIAINRLLKLKQKGIGAIGQYRNAVGELIETVKNNWSFNNCLEILGILNSLSKTVKKLGKPQIMDFTRQLKRALAEAISQKIL